MNDDLTLLREYARTQSEAAFSVLVSRHVDLVYSVALRQVGAPHLAGEITQTVFIILARKAGALGEKTILPGWLCRTARYASSEALRQQRRRQHHEQEAAMQPPQNESDSAETWQHIAPHLDEAMHGLGQKDHDALVLRFFQNKNFAEVGAELGASEDAAKMRVGRALDKLRKFFTKRELTLSAAVIAGAVAANSVQAAPAGLAGTISIAAVTKGAAVSASTLSIMKSTLKLMAWAKARTFVTYGLTAFMMAGLAGFVVAELNPPPSNSAPRFTVAGSFSSEGRQFPSDTNVFSTAGHFLFSFSEEGWRVQFYYDHVEFHLPGAPSALANRSAVMMDEKRIPFGTRTYHEFPPEPNPPKNLMPSATAQTNLVPDIGHMEIFLPWLALTPHPEIPLTDNHRMHRYFKSQNAGNSHADADYSLKTIASQNWFLSELTITNDGTYLLSDGGSMDCPKPYDQGFVEFSYQVLATTNCNGINFPRSVVLSQYAPMPNGTSVRDLFAPSVAHLEVEQIDFTGHGLNLKPLPANTLAMDARFGLTNVDHMNYMVTNDVWTRTPSNDVFLRHLVKVYEQNVNRRRSSN